MGCQTREDLKALVFLSLSQLYSKMKRHRIIILCIHSMLRGRHGQVVIVRLNTDSPVVWRCSLDYAN